MKAVIMAGGEGARLRPLTCDLPKPMVPLMDRPMMEYIVELLASHDFNDLAVTLHYLPEKVEEHFQDGNSFGVNLTYYLEDEPLGTAGSVKNASSFLDETFLVISGDCLTDINLSQAVGFHRRSGAMATIVLASQDNPLEYGLVMVNEEGRITRFLEKPRWGEVFTDTVNTGIYVLEPEVLKYIPPEENYDFSKDLFPKLLQEGEALYGCVLPGYWCDIGSPSQYMESQYSILSGKVSINIPAPEVEKGIWLAEGVQLEANSILTPPVYVGSGTCIRNGAQVGDYSVIGSGNVIGRNSSVKRGITWSGAHFGENTSLKGGILCRKVSLGSGAEVYEKAIVGDRSTVEEKSVIKPGVKIWPYKKIEGGTVVRENLIWGGGCSKSLFGLGGIKGELNVDISADMALKLGAVFGSLLGEGNAAVTGSDPENSSKMLKKALQAGLLSSGIRVKDLGEVAVPMLRLVASRRECVGGLYVQNLGDERGTHRLRFFDKDGMDLSQGEERKMEQLFHRDDFARAPFDSLKELIHERGMLDDYLCYLLEGIDCEAIKKNSFRILVAYPPSYLQSFLLDICRILGMHAGLLQSSSRVDITEQPYIEQYLKTVRDALWNMEADLAVLIDQWGEKMLLLTDKGELVKGESLEAALTLLQLRHKRIPAVAVPVTSPMVHEELARRYEGKVIRTKTIPRHRMESYRDNGIGHFPPSMDSIRAFVELLDFMAAEKKPLSEIIKEIPAFYMQEKEVPCSWSQKGRVMRKLIEEAPREKTEMIDGLKIYHPEGWALILPDPERPAYRVFGEGFSEEIAESLTDFYFDRLQDLAQEEENT